MRVAAFLATILLTTALTLGAGLLVALYLRGAPTALLIAAAAASPFLVVGPLFVGSTAAVFDHRAPTGGTYLRRLFLVVLALVVVAAAVVVATSVAADAPAWVPIVLAGGSAVLFVAARPVGALLRRLQLPLTDLRDQAVPGSDVVRRKATVIGITFVIAAVVSAVVVTVLNVSVGGRPRDAMVSVLLAGQLTFLATAMAAIVVALPFGRALRDAGERDADRLRRFGKVVLRGKDLPISEEEQPGAVRYAQVVQLVLQFNMLYVVLLYVSIAFQFVSGILRGSLVVFSAVFLVVMLATLAVLLPLAVRRIRRARRYVTGHAAANVAQRPS